MITEIIPKSKYFQEVKVNIANPLKILKINNV